MAKHYFAIDVAFCCVYALFIYLFASGFLLKRISFPNRTECENCQIEAQCNRAVILIIDALRVDFMVHIDAESPRVYHNRLTALHDIHRRHKSQSKFYKFRADPPTTTLQRLKGMTTGSLPTFIDVSKNFASSEIDEDNWIWQAIRHGKRLAFVGDDTWMSLFPKDFLRFYPFPSFNVKDLDTVDTGVEIHMKEELAKGDFDILIGHALGVDHCGHTFGPDHPRMGTKLSQMNKLIDHIYRNLPNDSLFLVMGDHGMTFTGDHGGDSENETAAGLFIYTPNYDFNFDNSFREIYQIDLVPSLSLLLGLPIPFSNLGVVVSEWFPSLREKAYSLNFAQIQSYLKTYENASSSLIDNNDFSINNTEKYLKYVQFRCRQKWAQFDVEKILFSLIGMIVSLLFHFFFYLFNHFRGSVQLNVSSVLFLLTLVLHFSNSFVVEEIHILYFAVISLLFLFLRKLNLHKVIIIAVLLRIAKGCFIVCREEQYNCSLSVFSKPLSSFSPEESLLFWTRFVFNFCIIFFVMFYFKCELSTMFYKFDLVSFFFLGCYWFFQPLGFSAISLWIARLVYVSSVVACVHNTKMNKPVAPRFSILMSITPILMMILNDNFGLAALVYVVIIQQLITCGGLSPSESVLLMFLLAELSFFTTGHHATFSSIQWNSGFHGFSGDFFTYAIPGLFIILNTFVGHFMFSFSLPYRSHSDTTLLLILSITKASASMVAATLLRRHLMVWKIFAPRMAFSVTSTAVIMAGLCLRVLTEKT